MTESLSESASFRDPSGFLFEREGELFRQVNRSYQAHYDRLMSGGLYQALVQKNLLVEHEETDLPPERGDKGYKIIRPRRLPFISYPYEWSFSQYKDAALATLEIQKTALKHGMTLKDASVYNIQFSRGAPLLIDTLSFEIYEEGRPWMAYRQFCMHFLAPLALMACTDIRLNQLMRIYIDGIPLDLASRLLSWKTRFRFSLLTHIHLHAAQQRKYADKVVKPRSVRISRFQTEAFLENLFSAVRRLSCGKPKTEWGDYYTFTNYSESAASSKRAIVSSMLDEVAPGLVWDLGGNDGTYSRVAAERACEVVCFDIDPVAVEKNYQEVRRTKTENILPLLLDLTNPSNGLGWAGTERASIEQRGPADLIMALALIHHLAISNNLPFDRIAAYLAQLTEYLIIEFVPKEDSKVQKLLATREDIFDRYDEASFEEAFSSRFHIERKAKVEDSMRTLYLMRVCGGKGA